MPRACGRRVLPSLVRTGPSELQYHRERCPDKGMILWKKQGSYEQSPPIKTECAQMFRGADVPRIRNNMQVIASRICACLGASSRGHISVSFGEQDSYQAPFSANGLYCDRLDTGPNPTKRKRSSQPRLAGVERIRSALQRMVKQ